MRKINITIIISLLVIGLLIFSPTVLIAGGLKDKIQQKINASRNLQYNLDVKKESSAVGQEQEAGARVDLYRDRTGAESIQSNEAPAVAGARFASASMVESPIISSYAIYKTDYQAEIEEDVVTVKGNVLFEIFKRGWTQLPLVRSNVGLIDVSINKGASFVTEQGGKYYLMIDKPGRYNLDIEFLIKANREREAGPGSFNFEVMPAPISQFEFTMPESGVEIFVEPAIKLELKSEPKKTIAWAVMPNTNSITVRWTKALPKETIAQVKLEPKVYADTATYASVGEGFIRCQTSLNYSILQSEISNLRVVLPEDVSVLEVRSQDLRDWKVTNKEGLQYLDVYLNFGVKGNYILNLSYERKIGEGSVVAQLPWVKAIGAEREKGFIGLAASTNVELAVNKIEHVTQIDIRELPPAIWSSTLNPILLAFKYSNHPYSIAIDVTRHEELAVLVATIDSADYVSLLTDEGKILTKATYQVRNNVKQFIRLVLPKQATLWSVFVAGKPVKPGKDKNGDILIPLEKSQLSGESLTQFPVEIVYLDKFPKMGLAGNLKLRLPQTDIPVNTLNWFTYLPLDYAYFNFGGDVKPSKRGIHIYTESISGVGEMKKEAAAGYRGAHDLSTQYAQQQAQVPKEEFWTAQMKGVLPIKIDIPEQGRLYSFSKLLVTEKESPWLSVSFITVFRQIHGLLRFIILVVILVVIGKRIFRKKAPKA